MPPKVRINRVENPILIEDAKIIYRNFVGEKRRFNKLGDRNFHVVIEDEGFATILMKDGWNLKAFKPRVDDEESMPGYHMEVAINFESSQPPKIVMITESRIPDSEFPGGFKKVRKGAVLSEETAGLLDSAEILKSDIEIRPYNWGPDDNGKTGVKAYLKTLYVTIKADPFADKYSDIVLTNDPIKGLKEVDIEE